jgi:hypothetical protein
MLFISWKIIVLFKGFLRQFNQSVRSDEQINKSRFQINRYEMSVFRDRDHFPRAQDRPEGSISCPQPYRRHLEILAWKSYISFAIVEIQI